MIRQYQQGKSVLVRQKDQKKISKIPQNRQTLHTIKLETELMNQIDFLSKQYTPQLNKMQIMRKLVQEEIVKLGLQKKYNNSPKKFIAKTIKDEEVLSK